VLWNVLWGTNRYTFSSVCCSIYKQVKILCTMYTYNLIACLSKLFSYIMCWQKYNNRCSYLANNKCSHNIRESSCHALICFNCPCACLHPSLGVAHLPHYPLGPYTGVFYLPVASSSCLFKSTSVLSQLLFLVLLVLTLACPDSEPACRPVPFPLLQITDPCNKGGGTKIVELC
jgi:hypothetical protein